MLIILITTSIIFILVSFALQIIFHELGHYLFGLLTGWKLIYLQFAHCVIYPDHIRKRYKFKMVPCKGFQCIMSPNAIDSISVGYTLGGLFVNLILSVLGLIAILMMYHSLFLFLFFLCFTVSGIALLVTNGIPMVKSLCNDMACFILTKDSKATSMCHNTQLIVAGELMQAKIYVMMQKVLFQQEENIEINDITAYSLILNYYYHLDKNDLQAAYRELIKINDYSKISNNVMHVYNLEILYLRMIMFTNGCETSTDSFLSCGDKGDLFAYSILSSRDKSNYYTNSVLHCGERKSPYKKNIKIGDIHELRVQIMYLVYIRINSNDISGAIEILGESVNSLRSLPCIYPGEKIFCEKQLMDVYNKLRCMNSNR